MTEQIDKEGIKKEELKQVELTFSFIKSIALGISGVLLLSMIIGYLLMFSFVDDNSKIEGIDSVFSGLDQYFLLFIGVVGLNILGLVLFGKSKIIGWWLYLLTNLCIAGLFIYMMDVTMFLLSAVYIIFSVLVGIYGFRRMKLNKTL